MSLKISKKVQTFFSSCCAAAATKLRRPALYAFVNRKFIVSEKKGSKRLRGLNVCHSILRKPMAGFFLLKVNTIRSHESFTYCSRIKLCVLSYINNSAQSHQQFCPIASTILPNRRTMLFDDNVMVSTCGYK